MPSLKQVRDWADTDLPYGLVADVPVLLAIGAGTVYVHATADARPELCASRDRVNRYRLRGPLPFAAAVDTAVNDGAGPGLIFCRDCIKAAPNMDDLGWHTTLLTRAAIACDEMSRALADPRTGCLDTLQDANTAALNLLRVRRSLEVPNPATGGPDWVQFARTSGPLRDWWAAQVPIWQAELSDLRARWRAALTGDEEDRRYLVPTTSAWTTPDSYLGAHLAAGDIVACASWSDARAPLPVFAVPASQLAPEGWVDLGADCPRPELATRVAGLTALLRTGRPVDQDAVDALLAAVV